MALGALSVICLSAGYAIAGVFGMWIGLVVVVGVVICLGEDD